MRRGSSPLKTILYILSTMTLLIAFQNCAPSKQFEADNNVVGQQDGLSTSLAGVDHDPLKSDEIPMTTPVLCRVGESCDPRILSGKTYTLEKVIVASQIVGVAPSVQHYTPKAFTLTLSATRVEGLDAPSGSTQAALSPPLEPEIVLQKITFSAPIACDGFYAGEGKMSRILGLPVASGHLSLSVTARAVPASMGCGFSFSDTDKKLRAEDGYKHLLESARSYMISGSRLYVHTNIVGVTAVFNILKPISTVIYEPLPIFTLDGTWTATSLTYGHCKMPDGFIEGPTIANYYCPYPSGKQVVFKKKNLLKMKRGDLQFQAACNSGGGKYGFSVDQKTGTQHIQFSSLISTQMACADLEEEQILLGALSAANRITRLADHAWEIEATNGARLIIKKVE